MRFYSSKELIAVARQFSKDLRIPEDGELMGLLQESGRNAGNLGLLELMGLLGEVLTTNRLEQVCKELGIEHDFSLVRDGETTQNHRFEVKGSSVTVIEKYGKARHIAEYDTLFGLNGHAIVGETKTGTYLNETRLQTRGVTFYHTPMINATEPKEIEIKMRYLEERLPGRKGYMLFISPEQIMRKKEDERIFRVQNRLRLAGGLVVPGYNGKEIKERAEALRIKLQEW